MEQKGYEENEYEQNRYEDKMFEENAYQQSESTYLDFEIERIDVEKEKRKDRKNNIKGTIIAAIIVFLVLLTVTIFEMEYQRTVNMWWLIIYGFCIHLVEKWIIVLFAVCVIKMVFQLDKRYGIALTLILMIFMFLHSPKFMRDYSLNGDGQNYGNMLKNQLLDVVLDDYEIIKPKKFDVIEKRFRGSKRTRKTTYYYYLDINDGEYVIPIMAGDANLIDSINNFEYVELKVHKHTKMLYEINGIKVNKLTRTDVNNINTAYEGTGCKLRITGSSVRVSASGDVNLNALQVATFNPAGEVVMALSCNTAQTYPLYGFEDGTWTVLVTDGQTICSNNMILYDVVNGRITNLRSQDCK